LFKGGEQLMAERKFAQACNAFEASKVIVEVPKFKELIKLTSPPTPALATLVAQPAAHDAVQSNGIFTTRRKIALGVAGVSVPGVALGASAKGKQDDAFMLCPDPAMGCTQADESNALIKASHSRALEANVAFGIAAAAAIGAGVLWFTGAPDAENPKRVSVVPRVMPGETGIAVMGRF